MSDFTFTSFHIAPNIAEYSFLEISLTVRLFLSILLTIPFSFAIKYLLNLQPVFLLNLDLYISTGYHHLHALKRPQA